MEPLLDSSSRALAPPTILAQFTNLEHYWHALAVLLAAVALGSVLAYHPSALRKASTRDALEQPKAIILYSLVGALVGHLVQLDPRMALVVFGIGGLLRFRTLAGDTKGTGRLILTTIVGVCCGHGSYLVAAVATFLSWLLIWFLERQNTGQVTILNISPEHLSRVLQSYRQALTEAGCRIKGERRMPKKSAVEVVFIAPSTVDPTALESTLKSLPASEFCDIDIDVS